MLLQRIISSVVVAPPLVWALYQLPAGSFLLLTSAICLLATWEWSQLAGVIATRSRVGCLFLMALLLGGIRLIQSIAPAVSYRWLNPLILGLGLVWWLLAFSLILVYPRRMSQWAMTRGWRLLFGVGALLPFWMGVNLLRFFASDGNEGAGWLFYCLLVVWGTDIGGYVIGSCLGRHRLLPQISPGKTWEGLAGGVLLALATAYGWWHYGPLSSKPPMLVWLAVALVVALSAIVGDLAESMLKRMGGLKDSGNLIPGHGGILDRIDSLTVAIPVFTWLRLGLFQ